MPTFETPYGMVDAPDLGAAQKWIAKQKAPSAAPAEQPKQEEGGFFERLWNGITIPDTAKKAVSGISEGASGFFTNLWDSLSAGTQGVSRYATDKAKLAPQQAQNIFEEAGSVQDARTQFVARNPQTGKMSVYLRTPEVETSRVGGAADVIGSMLPGAQLETRALQAVPKAATPATRMAETFKQEGVTPNLPAVAGSPAASRMAQLGRVVPFAGGPIERGIEETLGSTAQAVERRGAQLGTAAEAPEAGARVQNTLRGFAEDRSQATADYKEYDRVMHGGPPTQLRRSVALLQDLRGRYPTNEALTGLFTNPKLLKLHDALTPRTETIPARTSGMLDQFGRPTVISPAQTVQRGGELTAPEIKELRTQIGYLLENPQFGPEAIPRAQLRSLYGALTQDMQEAARVRGPAAVRALQQATMNYGMKMRVLDRLERLIKEPSADAVFARLNAAAQDSRSSDAALLQWAKKAMPEEEWGNLGASILQKMAQPRRGVRDTLSVAPDFSLASFTTNWNGMTTRAKDLIFGAKGTEVRDGLERLAEISQAQKNVARYVNVSRSGEQNILARIVASLRDVVVHPARAAAGAATLGTGWVASKALMSPAFVERAFKAPAETVRAVEPTGRAQSFQRLQRGVVAPARSNAESKKLERQEKVTPPAGIR